MIKASVYIFKSMAAMLDQLEDFDKSGDVDEETVYFEARKVQETWGKFSDRYQGDEGLQKICEEFEVYLQHRDTELMDKIKDQIDEIVYIRKLENMVTLMREKGQRGRVVNLT